MATKLEGGGGKALVAGPLKKITFFAASLTDPQPWCPHSNLIPLYAQWIDVSPNTYEAIWPNRLIVGESASLGQVDGATSVMSPCTRIERVHVKAI